MKTTVLHFRQALHRVYIKSAFISLFCLWCIQTNLHAQYGAGQRIHVYVQDGTLVSPGTNLTNLQWTKVTHVYYAFLNPMDATGSLYLSGAGDPGAPVSGSVWYTSSRFNNFLTTVRTANPNIKVIVSMGGAPVGSDGGTGGTAGNVTSRLNTIFANAAAANTLSTDIATFVERKNLDGFDLDLEHPITATELTNHRNFLSQVKTKLNAKESILCKDLELSIAINGDCNKMVVSPGGQDYVLPGVDPFVDVYHLMTYDASAANVGFTTHSPLQMCQDAVTAFSSPPFNWPKNKMCIGIAFYGRNGVGGALTSTYRSINAGNTSPPYNTDITGGYGYNGCPTITNKVNYARNNGLMGVVVWEGTQDILTGPNSLLSCIYTASGLASVPATEKTCCRKPNLGNDILTCNTPFDITLNSGTPTNTNVTFTWRRILPSVLAITTSSAAANTQLITSGNGVGTYVVIRDSIAGGITCSRSDTIVIAAALPTPDLAPLTRSLCASKGLTLKPNNSTAFPPGTTYQWQKNSVNITGETTNTLYVNSPGTYTLNISLAGCTNTTASVTVTGSGAVGVDACRTSAGTLNLSVTGGTGPYNWYAGDVPNNNLLQANSSTFTTPSLPLPSTTTYWVEDLGAMTNGTVGLAGPPGTVPFYNAIFATDPVTNSSSDVAMEFRVTGHVKITAVDVYPWGGSAISAGTPAVIRVEIYNINGGAGGVVYTSPNVSITAATYPTPLTIALDASLTGSATNPGYYRMRAFVVTNVGSGGTRLAFGHEPSGSPNPFPLTSGNISITSQRGTATYGPFYNWKLEDYGGCGRIPVRAIVAASCSGTLPAQFLYINAERDQNHVNVNWATASEQNTSHFVIERSMDGINFMAVGERNAQGQSATLHTYTYTDHNAPDSKLYYRLRTHDIDGQVQLSEIKTVEARINFGIVAIPNPFNQSTLLQFHGVHAEATLTIYDIQGRKILEKAVLPATENLSLGSELDSGFYIVELVSSTHSAQYKLIKE